MSHPIGDLLLFIRYQYDAMREWVYIPKKEYDELLLVRDLYSQTLLQRIREVCEKIAINNRPYSFPPIRLPII